MKLFRLSRTRCVLEEPPQIHLLGASGWRHKRHGARQAAVLLAIRPAAGRPCLTDTTSPSRSGGSNHLRFTGFLPRTPADSRNIISSTVPSSCLRLHCRPGLHSSCSGAGILGLSAVADLPPGGGMAASVATPCLPQFSGLPRSRSGRFLS